MKIQDPSTGASARVLAGFGFNCFSFVVPVNGQPLDVLWSAPRFESGTERPSGSGIPILFPFPGRIAGTSFRWEGQEYSLQAGDGRGNAIHGFVLSRPWRVIEQEPHRVTGQFQASVDDPAILDHWPADFRITVSYQVDGTSLRSKLVVDNPDSKPLPCGLGTHPYFRLPLGGDSAEQCQVELPVTRRWVLEEMLPTGARAPVVEADQYQSGVAFESMQFDDVFTDLLFDGDRCRPRITDPDSKVSLEVPFDKTFRECVVYTPPHREAICIEPYTCVPGAFGLKGDDIDTGLRLLARDESFEAQVDITIKH